MNNFQNLSKRIRKRIQNSVKRLFTSKSSTYENIYSPNITILKDNSGDNKLQSSYGSSKSYFSLDQRNSNPKQITETNQKTKYLLNAENINITDQQVEEFSSPDFGKSDNWKYSSSRVSVIKSSNINKSTSRSRSNKSKISYTCPTGRHSNNKDGDTCVCINIEQLLYHQSTPIVYEWHKFKSEPTSLDSLKLEYPNTCIQGGQGVVFWMYELKNNRHFALKMKLRESKSNSSWLIEQRESKMLRTIQHNFIVNLYHVHETPGAMFMTMEYLDGGCLWSHIAKKGTLPECYTIYYSACILNALLHLHQKDIVYRDLKAENIVLDTHGRPKLIDFGMAKRITHSNNYCSQKNIDDDTENYPATQYYYAAYLAPEIYSKPSSANVFIDSWGLGYVVSEILLGYGVFVSMPWEKITNQFIDNWKFQYNGSYVISNDCKDFLQKMLKYNSNSRMSLNDASSHPFFRQVHLPSLVYVKPPDLSVFKMLVKGSGTFQAIPNDKDSLSSLFEFSDLQLPEPLLTPDSNNQCNILMAEVPSPTDTPINPNAPSIRSPFIIKKDNFNHNKKNRISNNLKYDLYRALNSQDQGHSKIAIDTISNLRPLKKF